MNSYRKGTPADGQVWRISIRSGHTGAASLSTTQETWRNGERVAYDAHEEEVFPSYYQCQTRAIQLQKDWIAQGFVRADDIAAAEAVDEPPDVGGRYARDILIGSFDIRSGQSPHSSNLKNVASFYAHATFPGCTLPPVHIATFDLSKISIFPDEVRRYGLFHIVYSNHEECDAWMLDRDDGSITFRKNADGLIHVEDFANYEASCVADDVGTADRGQEWDLVLIPPSPLLMEIRGVRLGGLPVWWQGNDWPDCPECGKSMFYIAGIRAIQVPPDNGCGDQLLNAFLCEACGVTTVAMQMT